MKAPIVVRDAVSGDLPAVADLVVRCYVDEGFIDPASPYVHELKDVQARARDAEVLVASAGDDVVGTVTFCRAGTPWAEVCAPGEAEFRMLAVAADQRRGGVGRSLVEACLARARDLGAVRLVMSTTPGMVLAHRLYEQMGFVRLPERDWHPRPEVGLLVYGRDL